MWLEFHEAFDIQNWVPVLECKHCSKVIKHPLLVGKQFTEGQTNWEKSDVTTDMIRHLEGCRPYLKIKGKDSSLMDKFLKNSDSKQKGITENEVMNRILKFFISGNIAFNQANNPYFWELVALIKCHNDLNVKVNCSNITTRLHSSTAEAKMKFMHTLINNKLKISLVLDCWTS